MLLCRTSLGVLAVAIFGLTACGTQLPAAPSASSPGRSAFAAPPPSALEVPWRTHPSSTSTLWYIDGKVTNRCDHDLGYVQVEFNFYDDSGNQTGSGMIRSVGVLMGSRKHYG